MSKSGSGDGIFDCEPMELSLADIYTLGSCVILVDVCIPRSLYGDSVALGSHLWCSRETIHTPTQSQYSRPKRFATSNIYVVFFKKRKSISDPHLRYSQKWSHGLKDGPALVILWYGDRDSHAYIYTTRDISNLVWSHISWSGAYIGRGNDHRSL